jgi:heat shock protein HtpX
MGGLLVLLGYLVGMVWMPDGGGPFGVVMALGIWGVLILVAFFAGEKTLLLGTRARPIRKPDAPRLWNVVEEMTIASGLGTMPRIYILEQDQPNAFAAGPRPDRAILAVTEGLLKRLDRDELQGVIAHEIGHIKNLDVRFMTLATVMLTSITILADLFLRSTWYGAGRRRSSRGDPRLQLVFLAVGIVAAILAPLMAQLLYLACSRRREYLADASAARFTRYPQGLASALRKISEGVVHKKSANRVLAPLYIVNPLRGAAGHGLLSTHPPTEERIRILRGMAGGCGYLDYENAFRRARGAACLGKRTLAGEGQVAGRAPMSAGERKSELMERIRETDALLGRLAGMLLIACPCGVQVRIPPRSRRKEIACPRCGRTHDVPHAGPATAGRGRPLA